jgi:enoyl-CoA hydratase/carnithine racemase
MRIRSLSFFYRGAIGKGLFGQRLTCHPHGSAIVSWPGAEPMTLVKLERQGPVAGIVLNRPGQRNAVSAPLLEELRSALGTLAADADVRAVVLSGAGPDFCAGADMAELAAARTGEGGALYGQALEEAFRAIATHPVPVIARIHGSALGGGCQLAVACDLAVAADGARLGIPSGRLGIVVGFENIERLVLAVGPKRAAEILYAGRVLSGAEAAQWGLVNAAVPDADLVAATDALARAVAESAPLSVRASKRGIGVVLEHLSVDRFAEGHRVADFDMMAAEAFASDDLAEGLAAFRERRNPDFQGS